MSERPVLSQLAATITLALLLAACSSPVPAKDRVPLLTGYPQTVDNGRGFACSLDTINGLLSADPVYGTRLTWDNGGNSVPIMWPPGFAARRAGAEVEVLDEHSNVIAITGRRYWVQSAISLSGFIPCNIYPADS